MVLKGHRSIANQVRFNRDNHLLISSGVEKVIKVGNKLYTALLSNFMVDKFPTVDFPQRPTGLQILVFL